MRCRARRGHDIGRATLLVGRSARLVQRGTDLVQAASGGSRGSIGIHALANLGTRGTRSAIACRCGVATAVLFVDDAECLLHDGGVGRWVNGA